MNTMLQSALQPFPEVQASSLDSIAGQLRKHGCLLVRDLVPRQDIEELLAQVTTILNTAGWLQPGTNPTERIANPAAACGDPDPAYKSVYEQVFNLPAFHVFAHHPALQRVMHQLSGPALLIHPKPVARLVFPNNDRFVIKAHQDHHSIGGDSESFTAWTPLHDCPVELGPLQFLDASHLHGLQPTDPETGHVLTQRAQGGAWLGGPIHAGDVLFFHSLAVHNATSNSTNRLRISVDCRFQSVDRCIDPANLVFPGSGTRSWQTTYAGWPSSELQYYWKRLPLRLKPSKDELQHLAATTDSLRMQARYNRILDQLG